jgi:hypothetical protein
VHRDSRQGSGSHTLVREGVTMVVSGELIRMMNYVDEMATTLRRIGANIPTMSDDEKKRLADYIRKSDPSVQGILQRLEAK